MSSKKTPQAESLPFDTEEIIRILREEASALKMMDFYRLLGISKRYRTALEEALGLLQQGGHILQVKGGAWALAEQQKTVTGTLEVQRSGVGFILPDSKRGSDIFVAPHNMGDAWHKDHVELFLTNASTGRRPEGKIMRVLKRGQELVPVRVIKFMGKSGVLAQPTDTRLHFAMLVNCDNLPEKPRKHELLLALAGDKLEERLWAGVAAKSLGVEDDVTTQERLVKTNNDVPTEFPREVLQEAASLPEIPAESEFAERVDLRHLAFVTIDGATAKDFDDAIYVEEQSNGWRLWVAIADVSHYVPIGSALDAEALTRGNSYYFPQSVEPMFPEALSNGLCSLNPRVPRLTMVAEMFFYHGGGIGKERFYPAVIQSKARLTYDQVKRGVLDNDPQEQAQLGTLLPMLTTAKELALVLKEKRNQRGSLDFEIPEAEMVFNVLGEAIGITRRERHFGHQMIEEFMLAANEAVARFLAAHSVNFLYRAHPAPDTEKLVNFFTMLRGTELAHLIPQDADEDDLQSVLHAARGTSLEYLVSRLGLRTMMQARYTPEPEGHYGLASDCYCHFTSPIRRYADLVVHRALKSALNVPNYHALPAAELLSVSEGLNQCERRGMEAEREILKRLSVIVMQNHVGEEFHGMVSGLSEFGFWVELQEIPAEGMVRLALLRDDYYNYDAARQELVGERTGRVYRMGHAVRVRLEDVNVSRLEINLSIINDERDHPRVPKYSRKKKPRPQGSTMRRSYDDYSGDNGSDNTEPRRAQKAQGTANAATETSKVNRANTMSPAVQAKPKNLHAVATLAKPPTTGAVPSVKNARACKERNPSGT